MLRRLLAGSGWILGTALLGAGLGLSGSRGTLVASGVALLGFGVFVLRGRLPGVPVRVARALLVAGLAMGIGFVATGTREDLRSPFSGFEDGDREAISSGRDAIWANSWDVAVDHPFVGVGVAAVPAVYDTYRDQRMAEGGLHSKSSQDPHSFYLQLLAGLGPVGLMLFLVAGTLIWREAGSSPLGAEARFVLVFLLFSALSQSTLELNDFWFAVGWCALAASLRELSADSTAILTSKA